MSNRKNTGRGFGKGYYIALILCAAAIGISGYLYYQNANNNGSLLRDPTSGQEVLATGGEDVAAVGTQPTIPELNGDGDTSSGNRLLKTGLPLAGTTLAEYAMDCLSYNQTTRDWRTHNGIDIGAAAGSVVCAAADGVVYTTFEDETMGTTVVIRHADGYVTRYSSLDKELSVSAGDAVALGQPIGKVGTTALLETAVGDHVHFSVTCDGESMDPAEFFAIH